MIRSFSALVHLHAVVSLVCCLELEITQNGTYSLWIYYSGMEDKGEATYGQFLDTALNNCILVVRDHRIEAYLLSTGVYCLLEQVRCEYSFVWLVGSKLSLVSV